MEESEDMGTMAFIIGLVFVVIFACVWVSRD